MKKWLWAAAAFLIAVGFAILGRDGKAAEKAGAQRDELLKDGSDRAKAKAEAAGKKADKHQANAVKAAEVGKATMDKVGTNNESIGQLLDSWHKPVDGV